MTCGIVVVPEGTAVTLGEHEVLLTQTLASLFVTDLLRGSRGVTLTYCKNNSRLMELKKHKLPSDFYLSELVTTLNIQKPVLFTQGI